MNHFEKIFPFVFPFFFIGMWCTVLRMLSFMSGWTQLAERFHHPEKFEGKYYRFQSARMKQVNFSSALEMGVNQLRTLTALTNMGQLAPIVENMTDALGPSAVRDFYLWIFNTLDTELARRVMASASKGSQPDKEGGVLS